MIYAKDGRRWTFKELGEISNQVAHALIDDGVEPQDRIAYLDKNSPEYFPLLYGGAKLNAVSVTINWQLAPPEMEYILNDSEAKILMVGKEYLPALTQMNLEHVRRIVVIGDPGDFDYPT